MPRKERCVVQGDPVTWWQSQDQSISLSPEENMVAGHSFRGKGSFLSSTFSTQGKGGISSNSQEFSWVDVSMCRDPQ